MRNHIATNHVQHKAQAQINRLAKKSAQAKGRLTNAVGRIKGKTSRMLAKSFRTVKSKTKDISQNVDRIVVKNRYQTIGAAVVTGLCLGYFLKNK